MYCSHVPGKLSSEQVIAEVQKYWNVATRRITSQAWANFFSMGSVVFSTTSTRPEPGRLVAVRRSREYLGKDTKTRIELGPAEVLLVGESAAVACYTMQFHASEVKAGLPGAGKEEHLANCRVTQVFTQDSAGKILLIHEHISVPSPD
jgi:ketosteroid isomerase-like protein